jgi:7-cyano-7-deazaguanine synthase in queuosine biosynthesis
VQTGKHYVLCAGASKARYGRSDKISRLSLAGSAPNVDLEITDISRRLASDVPDVLTDLIEIATYVYCADQAVTRGGEGVLDFGKGWRRRFHFVVPVREPKIWGRPEVANSLKKALAFLSEDEYDFEFLEQSEMVPLQRYLTSYTDGYAPESTVEEVLLFSGGLDSLAGAASEAVKSQKQVALVSHRSNPKIASRQQELVQGLRRFCAENAPLHIPVWAHQQGIRGREYTQRTRSFLYASMAFAVARVFGLSRIRFYENGVVSLNLPISEQVVGSRATRTTHPQTLGNFGELFSLLAEQRFTVENPFLWKTRAEVVNVIGDAGCGELIGKSSSCMHTWEQTTEKPHCGQCSQCIGRRFATLASKYFGDDPADIYKVDLLEGPRDPDKDLTLVESFIRTARNMRDTTDAELIESYGEISRILQHVPPLSANQVAEEVIRLHRTHAREVSGVLERAIGDAAPKLVEQSLPSNCAIVLALPQADSKANTHPFRRPPQKVHSGPAGESNGTKSPYSKNDDKVFRLIGEANFRNLSNRTLYVQFSSQIRQLLKRPLTADSCRACLNRIRRHWKFPRSEDIGKKAVNR